MSSNVYTNGDMATYRQNAAAEDATLERKVRRALDGGELTVKDIAEQLSVSTAYVKTVRNRWTSEKTEEVAAPAPVVEDVTVECLVKDKAEISARTCVDAQRDSHCWCSKAVPAIKGVEPMFEPAPGDSMEVLAKKRRMREELDTLKGRCETMYRRPAAERFDGPAAAKMRGEKIGLPLSSPVPLPAPPAKVRAASGSSFQSKKEEPPLMAAARAPANVDTREDEHEAAIAEQENRATSVATKVGIVATKVADEEQPAQESWAAFRARRQAEREAMEADAEPPAAPAPTCRGDGCRTSLRVNNTTGLCRVCRNKVTSRQREALVPKVARAAGTAGNALRASVEPSLVERAQARRGEEQQERIKEIGQEIDEVLARPPRGGPCKNCGDKTERRNTTGFCKKADCKAALAKARAAAMPRCATPGCTRPAFSALTGQCHKCQAGVRPGSGFDPCATEGCPKRVQRFRGEKHCTYCRRGLKLHLDLKPKENPMPTGTPKDAGKHCAGCSKVLRSDNTRNACTTCINGLPLALRPKAGQPVDPAVFKKGATVRQARTPVAPEKAPVPADPVPAETAYPGLPPVDQVPIGYAKKLHEWLRKQGISFDAAAPEAA